MAKVLIGCETSGIVREAFLAHGHDAWSCDLLPADTPTNRHIQGDVRDVMQDDWDLMAVMHPPCTRLTNSGVRWLSVPPPGRSLEDMWRELEAGAELFSAVWTVPHIPCIAVENPVMHKHAKARIRDYRPPAQTVQPWQFGNDPEGPDNERKRTCFWLRDLPPLQPTGSLDGASARDSVHKASPGADRWKLRSKFFPGIAAAMADQWGEYASRRHAAQAA
ncbi:hypothetical protein [Pseudooceanicola sp.]|uniref:hypothetical protein n=1 Tax=Pseudooceanicola sp. TaxID=1914328 RepID=UPI003512B0BC